MLAVSYFLIFIVLVIVSGPLLAYPLYLSLQTITDIEFHKLVGHATLLCGLLLSFIYLKINDIPFGVLEGADYKPSFIKHYHLE